MFQVFLYMSLILEHNETEEESQKVDEFSKTYFVTPSITGQSHTGKDKAISATMQRVMKSLPADLS